MRNALFLLSILMLLSCNQTDVLNVDYRWEDIIISSKKNTITVQNSQMKRVWKLTDYGLVTQELTNLSTGKVWNNDKSTQVCDWSYFGLVDESYSRNSRKHFEKWKI